jgi:hypothetical protein
LPVREGINDGLAQWIPNKETLAMLWAHKALRIFSDCLIDDSIDDDDRKYFVAAWASTHSRSRSR